METEKYYDPDWRDRLWQRWHGVDVEGILPVKAIASDQLAASSRGTFYQPVPVRYLKRIVTRAKNSGVVLTHFVDMGCGKGKACLYMSRTGLFSRVIGVEISPKLITIARENRTAMSPPTPLDFIEADAQTYQLPDAPTLVFLFNPFDALALSRFIAFNGNHFRRHRSIIAYAFDIDREILEQHGFTQMWREARTRFSFHALA
jgi:SAM-dependent methyltransferase